MLIFYRKVDARLAAAPCGGTVAAEYPAAAQARFSQGIIERNVSARFERVGGRCLPGETSLSTHPHQVSERAPKADEEAGGKKSPPPGIELPGGAYGASPCPLPRLQRVGNEARTSFSSSPMKARR